MTVADTLKMAVSTALAAARTYADEPVLDIIVEALVFCQSSL